MSKRWASVTDFGYGRHSDPDNTQLLKRLGPAPYEFRNELRPYQLVHYDHHLGRVKLTHSIRIDERFYYNQDFSGVWTTPFELRLRYMLSARVPLTTDHKNAIIVNDEVLSAIDKKLTAIRGRPASLPRTGFRCITAAASMSSASTLI